MNKAVSDYMRDMNMNMNMKKYFVALSEPSKGVSILGGGWSKQAALDDAKLNAASESVYALVRVDEATGKEIEDQGDTTELASYCFANGVKA